jgi:general secretion pathway protein G
MTAKRGLEPLPPTVVSAVMRIAFPQISEKFAGSALIALCSVLIALAFTADFDIRCRTDDFRRSAAKVEMRFLSDKVRQYRIDHGSLPTTLGQLTEMSPSGRPYLKKSNLRDPYGREFAYKVPGNHGNFDIVYLGKDGKPGGTRYDADVGIWELPAHH